MKILADSKFSSQWAAIIKLDRMVDQHVTGNDGLGYLTTINGFLFSCTSPTTAKLGMMVNKYKLTLPFRWIWYQYLLVIRETFMITKLCRMVKQCVLVLPCGWWWWHYHYFMQPTVLTFLTSSSPITTKFNRKVGHFHCHYFTGDNEVTTTRSYGFISPSINIVITKLGRVTCYHAPVLASSWQWRLYF